MNKYAQWQHDAVPVGRMRIVPELRGTQSMLPEQVCNPNALLQAIMS